MMQAWQLPEYIADILPSDARRLESAKEELLSLFCVHGYALVNPPLMEYTQSLLTRIDSDLSHKTIRFTDHFSGRQMGVRADITPQISRIDAHLLGSHKGINRLCYAGSVLHARPDTLYSTRDPLQIGAELYGFAGIQADMELIDLMLQSMQILGVEKPVLSLGHIGIFRALTADMALSPSLEDELLEILKTKDASMIAAWCHEHHIDEKSTNTLLALTELYGSPMEVLKRAEQKLPQLPEIQAAFIDLRAITAYFKEYTQHLDLAELRSDRYHSGLLFAAYREGESDAIARGGRYDGLGQYFGRARPASGFSFDLKNFLEQLPQKEAVSGICVAAEDAMAAQQEMKQLRASGEVVIVDYLNEGASSLHCNRVLQQQDDQWQVLDLEQE